jgi:DNA-binding PadR family transcriptional regulator
VRRKPGALIPFEIEILAVAADLAQSGVRDFHGYELAKHLADVSNRRLLTAYGTLYRALARLEKMGLLASRGEDPHIAARENRPARRLYSLTGVGVAAARREIAARVKPKKGARRRVAPA